MRQQNKPKFPLIVWGEPPALPGCEPGVVPTRKRLLVDPDTQEPLIDTRFYNQLYTVPLFPPGSFNRARPTARGDLMESAESGISVQRPDPAETVMDESLENLIRTTLERTGRSAIQDTCSMLTTYVEQYPESAQLLLDAKEALCRYVAPSQEQTSQVEFQLTSPYGNGIPDWLQETQSKLSDAIMEIVEMSLQRKGMLVVIEGIDGSGKATQTKLLVEALRNAGLGVETLSFPQYEQTFSGALVGRFLNKDFGTEVHPILASLPYALDRFEAKPKIEQWLCDGKIVVLDRYTSASLGHQVARAKPEERLRVAADIHTIEHDILGVPKPDLTILLDVTPQNSHQNVANKEERPWLSTSHDLLEADPEHLGSTREVYLALAKTQPNWICIACTGDDGQMRSIDDIHHQVHGAVYQRAIKRAVDLFDPINPEATNRLVNTTPAPEHE